MQQQATGEIGRYDISFDSADGNSRIRGYLWWDENPLEAEVKPRGVVLLLHGMCEHIERYDEFARDLARHGYLACGHNQIGHGSSTTPERLGCLPVDGREALLADVHELRRIVVERVGENVPLFVFGHSMGSFITRSYIAHHGGGLAGAIICGTGFIPPAKSRAGRTLARLIARVRGVDYKSPLLQSMAEGSYSSMIEDAQTPSDWLSFDRDNVNRFLADDECGFTFSAGGYATLTDLTAEVCTLECAQRVPHQLPLLYIAGAEDPVGDFGVGPAASAELARKAGSEDVTCKIYENMRHEILKEKSRDVVVEDVLTWLDSRAAEAEKTCAPFRTPKQEA